MHVAQIVRIDHVNADRCPSVLGRDQSVFQRKRRDAGQHVAAIGGHVDSGLVDFDLAEQVVQIDTVDRRFADNRDLAGQWIRAAEPVNLALIRRSHDRQQDPVP